MPPTHQVPRAAYVHVPFCRHRCGYCNFTLIAGRDDLIEGYLRALALELQALAGPHPVRTLFLGGGTPTHLPPDQLQRLLELVQAHFPLEAGAEFSVEANPLDLDETRVEILERQGVTRLSLGVQSFHDEKLARLERDHRLVDIRACWTRIGGRFDSLALDLIFAVPGESLAGWSDDLAAAVALQPQHVSTYGLTIEPGAAFFGRARRGELHPPDEETQRLQYLQAIDTLQAAGFEHYEVSNFARPGHRCRHNQVYWTGQPFFGVGPGAASYRGGVRVMNHRSTTTYLRRVLAGGSPIAEREQLPPRLAAQERLVFGLRRLEGIDLAAFQAETGFSLQELAGDTVPQLIELQLLVLEGQQLRLSREGLLVSDALWSRILTHP